MTEDEGAPVIQMAGELGQTVSLIRRSSLTMSIETGVENEVEILVPMMTCGVKGTFGRNDAEGEYSTTLTFDNAAFLFMSFATGYLDSLQMLDSVSKGELPAAPGRMAYAIGWLQQGSEALKQAAAELGRIADRKESRGFAPVAEDEPQPRPAMAKRRKSGSAKRATAGRST